MVNPNIAPPAKLNIQERIRELEKYLEEQEKKLITPKPVQAPIKKLEEPVPPENEVVVLLKKITENQEIERKRWERNNPTEFDDPIYDWLELELPPGFIATFTYTIPEGRIFYFEYLNITYNADTVYSIWIDGAYQPILTDVLQDFGDHAQIWKPQKMCYNNVQITALNNGIITQNYATFFRGWNRWSRAVNREITYESLQKEKVL